jgi:predicted transcriptional regulator
MLVPCETVTKNFLPAVRAAVTKALVKRHGFTQAKAAEAVGITQAGVNKYLLGKYSADIKRMEKSHVIQNLSREMVAMITVKSGRDQLAMRVCDACENFHGSKCMIRHLSEQLMEEFSKKK